MPKLKLESLISGEDFFNQWSVSGLGSAAKCAACTGVVKKLSSELLKPELDDKLIGLSTVICKKVISYDPEGICPGIIPMMATPVIDLVGRELLSKERVCNEWLGFCEIPKYETVTVDDFAAKVLAEKPEMIQNDDYITNFYAQIKNDPNPRPTLKVVHMSDPHIDLEYAVGSLNQCDSFICCRAEFGFPEELSKQAGQFGSYLCDLPLVTLQSMLKFIAETTKPDLFFWTGDNAAHNDWDNTNEEVTNYTLVITQAIKDAFQGQDIPVYPSLGNHDTWPVNVMDFTKAGENYPINHIVDSWEDWIGADAATKFSEWGYYSTEFKLPGGKGVPGSRVISLNTQASNTQNWYLPGFKNDPADHIAWLENELKEIEAAGGYAYIIGHIMPKDFLEVFGGRYQALMERYQHIVRFSMYGHTHDQYYQVTRSRTNPEKMIGLTQIGPSVTTDTWENPAFALIEVDEATMLPINWQIYGIDLIEANKSGVADWKLLIDYVKDYQMEEMSPNALFDLTERFALDSELLHSFQWGKSRFVGKKPKKVSDGLNEYCSYTMFTGGQVEECLGKTSTILSDPVGWAFNYLVGDWKVKAGK